MEAGILSHVGRQVRMGTPTEGQALYFAFLRDRLTINE